MEHLFAEHVSPVFFALRASRTGTDLGMLGLATIPITGYYPSIQILNFILELAGIVAGLAVTSKQ